MWIFKEINTNSQLVWHQLALQIENSDTHNTTHGQLKTLNQFKSMLWSIHYLGAPSIRLLFDRMISSFWLLLTSFNSYHSNKFQFIYQLKCIFLGSFNTVFWRPTVISSQPFWFDRWIWYPNLIHFFDW